MVIRSRQIDSFREHRLHQFEETMLGHIREHFAEHYRSVPEEALRELIRLAHARAGKFGLDTVRSVCIYLNCMLWMGSRFDSDPQYPWARAVLTNAAIKDQRDRASRLSDVAVQHMLRLAGPQNQNYADVAAKLLENPQILPEQLVPDGIHPAHFLATRFPAKWDALPEELRSGIFHSARRLAARYGLNDDRSTIVYAMLMFLLGHGFDNDPQFPWAASILNDPAFNDAQKLRALLRSGLEQLRKATTD